MAHPFQPATTEILEKRTRVNQASKSPDILSEYGSQEFDSNPNSTPQSSDADLKNFNNKIDKF